MTDPTPPRVSPALLILGASIVSGAAGYLVTAIVADRVSAPQYTAFAVFWSALYLVVGTFGGVQQEFARATSVRGDAPASGARGWLFAVVVAGGLLALLAGTAPLWAAWVLDGSSPWLALPLAAGAASYVIVAALAGTLYGVTWWMPLVALIVIDGLARLAGVLLVLALGGDLLALGWAVAIPFPLAVLLVLPVVASRLRREAVLDVGMRALSWNVARTVVAAAATAALISGFPLLLGVTAREPGAALAPIILALTLTRAPIVIPLMSLQSYFIVRFGDRRGSLLGEVGRVVGVVIAVSVVLAGLAAWIGPGIIVAVFGAQFTIGAGLLFVLVASSGLVAALCVTGPAVLALAKHGHYVAGWAAGALLTVGLLLLPVDLDVRTSLALTAGPLVGVIVHLAGILEARRATAASDVSGR